jgi:hypothetical protein
MTMRISKYLPIAGIGNDFHCVLPPQVPPTPPPPAVPLPIPSYPWTQLASNPASGLIFGKFTWKVTTEGMGDVLMGHDWGMVQPHIPKPPYSATPALITTLMGASFKYFLPSYSVQQIPTGGAIAAVGPSGSAVAISTPAFMIITQVCIDVGGGPCSLVAPTGVGFQVPSTRWVGFTWADLGAGLISLAADAASAAASGAMGNAMTNGAEGILPGIVLGVVMNTTGGLMQSVFNSAFPTWGGLAIGGFVMGTSVIGAPAAIGLFGGRLADTVGGSERPWDTGERDGDRDAPLPAAPATTASASTATPAPDAGSGGAGGAGGAGSAGGGGGAGGAGDGASGGASGPEGPGSTGTDSGGSDSADGGVCGPDDPNAPAGPPTSGGSSTM